MGRAISKTEVPAIGVLDLIRLSNASEDLVRPVYAANTIDGYASDWRLFERWCGLACRSSLPADSGTVRLYITWMLIEKGHKVTTAEHHLAAIVSRHRLAGFEKPTSSPIRGVLNAVKRLRRERPAGREVLTVPDLVRVVEACPPTSQGRRDRAILVLGFATSCRRSELARLHTSDVSFDQASGGVIVSVRYGKTDQGGLGRVLGVWPGQRPSTDPVSVLRAWLERRGDWAGPLFTTTDGKAISGDAIYDVVKRAVGRAGINPERYGAHSLRAGAITASAEIGMSDQEIMHLSGHTSHKVMSSYIRRSRLFAGRNPLAGVL